MKINDIYNIKIDKIDNYGNGIARIDNAVIFIKGTFVNEYVKIKIIDIKKRYARGEVLDIIEKSNERQLILCDNYYQCGGCDYLHLKFSEENKLKEQIIQDLFSNYKTNNIVYDNEFFYRNKVIFHVKDGQIGFYKKDTNNLISVNECLLLNSKINEVLKLIKNIDLSKLNEVMVRVTTTNEIMIVFYGSINKEDLIYLTNNCQLIKSIYVNDKLVFGNEYITEKINNISYTVSPQSFMQINPQIMLKLYDKIKEYAGHGKKLLDLYCGTGTISIYLKDNFKVITGIEIVYPAIKNANQNKKINNINNIKFICADASNIKNDNYDVIVLDPPRSGLSTKVINKINQIKPERLIYVSCNYKTLKKDFAVLDDKYQVIEISTFNMFPKTNNIECVCVMKLR